MPLKEHKGSCTTGSTRFSAPPLPWAVATTAWQGCRPAADGNNDDGTIGVSRLPTTTAATRINRSILPIAGQGHLPRPRLTPMADPDAYIMKTQFFQAAPSSLISILTSTMSTPKSFSLAIIRPLMAAPNVNSSDRRYDGQVDSSTQTRQQHPHPLRLRSRDDEWKMGFSMVGSCRREDDGGRARGRWLGGSRMRAKRRGCGQAGRGRGPSVVGEGQADAGRTSDGSSGWHDGLASRFERPEAACQWRAMPLASASAPT
ncbi:hypothetical protein ACLOJK_020056 [Asimina triloba]